MSTQGQTLEFSSKSWRRPIVRKFTVRRSAGLNAIGPSCNDPLLKALEPGSVIVVTRLDRLGRSTIDLLTIVKQIADRGCLFKSLADPWADTTTPAGRLMLTVLGGLAEFERELIKARTTEGRERAKRAGVKMGEKTTAHAASDCRNPRAKGRRRSVRFLARSTHFAMRSGLRIL